MLWCYLPVYLYVQVEKTHLNSSIFNINPLFASDSQWHSPEIREYVFMSL